MYSIYVRLCFICILFYRIYEIFFRNLVSTFLHKPLNSHSAEMQIRRFSWYMESVSTKSRDFAMQNPFQCAKSIHW